MDQIAEGAERLRDVGIGLWAVNLVEVDPVRLQSAQAVLDLANNPAARVAELVRVIPHRPVHLGRQDDVVTATTGKCLANDLLRLAARVHVCRVDEVDACVERAMDDPDAVLVIGISPLPKHHRPKAQWADPDSSAAQYSVLDDWPPSGWLTISPSRPHPTALTLAVLPCQSSDT